MKLLYFGSSLTQAMELIKKDDLIVSIPPDIEAPFWELQFEGDISMYCDVEGKMLLVVQGEPPDIEEKGKEKLHRIKRGISRDNVLETG